MGYKTKLIHNLDTVEVIDSVDKCTKTTSCSVLPPSVQQGIAMLKALVIALTNSKITTLHSAVQLCCT